MRDAIVAAARELGFVRVGFVPIEPIQRGERALADWLRAGHHGEMAYMAGPRADVRLLLAEAQSLIVVALPYASAVATPSASTGIIARYARGADYHDVLKAKLRDLAERVSVIASRPVLARPCVDTAPLLEREAAHRGGIGFIAKNTMAIAPGLGSYIFLGELLVDIPLTASEPAVERCGQCTRCLDACPTGAFVGPWVLNARRCISYLTIELRGPIPRDLRPLIGRHVFGCDICQEVCPFNAKDHPGAPELEPRAELQAPALTWLLHLTAGDYRRLVKGSALRRASRWQLARNAAVALGNCRDVTTIPDLISAARQHRSPLVRGHAVWALSQIGGSEALAAVAAACQDPDPFVVEEAVAAMHSPSV